MRLGFGVVEWSGVGGARDGSKACDRGEAAALRRAHTKKKRACHTREDLPLAPPCLLGQTSRSSAQSLGVILGELINSGLWHPGRPASQSCGPLHTVPPATASAHHLLPCCSRPEGRRPAS